MSAVEKEFIDNLFSIFCKNLTIEQKKKAKYLFKTLKTKDWKKLIKIWNDYSAIIRWNNVKIQLKTIVPTNLENYLNLTMIGLQHYVDIKKMEEKKKE